MAAASRPGQAALDRWSAAHVATGLGLGLLPVRWPLVFALLVAYEVFEAALRRVKVEEGGVFEFESWPNIAADILLGMGGYATTHYLLGWRLW